MENGIENLTIDYTTYTNERILSMNYTEIGGYNGELFVTYDNFGNMADLRDNSGNSAMAMLVDPNNALITQYNPEDIDDPHSYRARDGFIGIEMWPGQDNRVYLQGHVVIPDDWGNVSTNGETTTTTDDTTDKDGGDDAEPSGKLDDCKDKFSAKLAAMCISAGAIISIIGVLSSAPEAIFTKLGAIILIVGVTILAGISILIA